VVKAVVAVVAAPRALLQPAPAHPRRLVEPLRPQRRAGVALQALPLRQVPAREALLLSTLQATGSPSSLKIGSNACPRIHPDREFAAVEAVAAVVVVVEVVAVARWLRLLPARTAERMAPVAACACRPV
jgi:hypothetical protein